jgi:HSP20 family protein
MDRLVEGSVLRPSAFFPDGHGATFPVDLYETADAFVLKATLPGVRPEQLDVNATSEGVSIKAEVKADQNVKDEAWILRERRTGLVTRAFTLPTQIDPNKIEANLEHGVLTLTLPKAEAVKPKQIKVKATSAGQSIEAQSR